MILGCFLLVLALAFLLLLIAVITDSEGTGAAGAVILAADLLYIIVTAGIYSIQHG
jgi:hypothetical protein